MPTPLFFKQSQSQREAPDGADRPNSKAPDGADRPNSKAPDGADRPNSKAPDGADKPGSKAPEGADKPGSKAPEGADKPLKLKPGFTSPTGPVKEMQTEMQSFAGILVPPGSDGTQAKSLGYFLIHYPATARVSIRKRDPKTGTPGKETEEVKDYQAAVDSIRLIGRSKEETKPDGIWGRRTQTAIKNISIISGDLIQLATDIEYTGGAEYTSSDKTQLDSAIPDADSPYSEGIRDLGERANKITPILKKLNTFAKNLHQHLVDTYTQYERKADPFAATPTDIVGPGRFEADEFDSDRMNSIKPFNIEYSNKMFNISLSDLSDFSVLSEKIKKVVGEPNFNQWMVNDYEAFLIKAKAEILKNLKEQRQILSPQVANKIKKIKENIKECERLNNRVEERDYNKYNFNKKQIDEIKQELKAPQKYKDEKNLDQLLTLTENLKKIYSVEIAELAGPSSK
jgi:hypothetical protein